jgi:type IV secretory pathway TrbD component
MSVIDLLMKQGLILIGVGLVVLTALVAIFLLAIPRLKAWRAAAKEAARKQAEEDALFAKVDRRARRARRHRLVDEDEEDDAEVEAAAPERRAALEVTVTDVPETKVIPVGAKTIPTGDKPPPKATNVSAAPPPAETKPAEEAKPEQDGGGMKDLLDVFVDEEAAERYRLLMDGIDTMDADELAELARAAFARLRERAPR